MRHTKYPDSEFGRIRLGWSLRSSTALVVVVVSML